MSWSVRNILTQTLVASSAIAFSTAAFAAETAEEAQVAAQQHAAEAQDAAEAHMMAAQTDAQDAAEEAEEAEVTRTAPTPPPIGPAPSFARSSEATNTLNSFHADMDLRFRVQPLGLVLSTRMYNEFEYMRNNISLLFSHVYLRGGAVVNLSPAYAEGGLDVEFQPIRIFNVRAQYVAGYHFGTFKYLIPFDNPDPITRDRELKELSDTAQSGVHHRLEVSPTIQMALGNIALRNSFHYQRVWYPTDEFQGPWVRESSYDRMVSTGGDTILSNLLLVAYKVWDPDGAADGQLLIGPFHEWSRGVNAKDNRHRVGLTGVLIPKHNWGKIYRPRLILQGGYNVVDRANGRANRAFIQGSLGFTLHGRR